MNLSICIITKNECENLRKCLQSIFSYPFEIVVVDTGSDDGTIVMAKEFTNSIYTFEWCNDFAKAKNYAVSKAANDQVLVLDSDEYLRRVDLHELEKQIKENPYKVGRILRRNQMMQGGELRESIEYINRLYDRRNFFYCGRIHEQLVSIDGSAYETYKTAIVLDHSGYLLTDEQKEQKADRNIRLLLEELQEKGNDPYVLYQLGKSFYLKKDYEKSCDYFSAALKFDLDPGLEYVIDMVDCYGYAMLNAGRAQEALGYEGIYEEFGHNADFQFLMGLIYMNNELFEDAVLQFQKAAVQKEARMQGVNGYLAYYNIGVIYDCLGDLERARQNYRKCGEYPPARERMAQINR